jgi:4-amino-4-deoxy-L-arabinose transferase-like glycosyltransferase
MIFKKHLGLVLFLLGFGSLLFYKLVFFSKPLFDWDESLYVQNGLEMLKHRSFLVPVWQGQPWLDKPPLSPLLLGLVAKYCPLPVEISTRLYTLFLSLIALILAYKLYLKAQLNRLLAVVTVVITAFLPIFLQRAQVVSLDVTLLIGWLGFFLWFEKPIISTLFLFLSVQSKSLLGFYPLVIYLFYLAYQYLTKQIKSKDLVKKGRSIFFQGILLSFWYLLAFAIYKNHFIQAHIIESHFRRVSASLESHFGQRTFYLDMLKEQLGWLFSLSVLGIFLSFYKFTRKKISTTTFLLQNAFLPWFIFLNLTKTKISWYLYPVLPQFAFYAVLPLSLIKHKAVRWLVSFSLILLVIYQALIKQNLLTTFYSQNDTHIKTAKLAKQHCQSLAVLVPSYTRETFSTLKKMGLTIETTSWWGEHPSMVYYFGKPLRFYYSSENFQKAQEEADCVVVNPQDKNLIKNQPKLIKSFDNMLLYK